jgi:hypothetical protein
MSLDKFIALLPEKPWKYRLKISHQELKNKWSLWLIQPTAHYLETKKDGPFPLKEIAWIDIDPIVMSKAGKLLPEKSADQTEMISTLLKEQQVEFIIVEDLVRIML